MIRMQSAPIQLATSPVPATLALLEMDTPAVCLRYYSGTSE